MCVGRYKISLIVGIATTKLMLYDIMAADHHITMLGEGDRRNNHLGSFAGVSCKLKIGLVFLLNSH